MVPYDEHPLIDQHLAQFKDDTFPKELEGFTRLYVDAIAVPSVYWPGKQLLVVYGSADYVKRRTTEELNPSLKSLLLTIRYQLLTDEQDTLSGYISQWKHEVQKLWGSVAERDHQLHDQKLTVMQLQLQRQELMGERDQLQSRLREQHLILDRDRLLTRLRERDLSRDHARLQDQMNARAQELIAARDQAAAERDRLYGDLNVVYRTKAWRLMSAYWQARSEGLPGILKLLFKGLILLVLAPFAIVYFLIRTVYHVLIPRNLRIAFWEVRWSLIHRSGAKRESSKHMSWYTYAFDTYKRERMETYSADMQGLRCPYVPGMVSVVLPVYNGADMLEESLQSILDQTYTNFELIAIDDGSTDETGAILDRYAERDARIRVIHQKNRKLPRTLSRGCRIARGEFLTWTSNDNRMKPNFLRHMVLCLTRHPKWDMIYANVDIIDEDGSPLRSSDWYLHYQQPPGSEHIYLPEDPSELGVWPNNYVGAAFMYRNRAAWLLGDYSPHRFTTEDYDYWMRVNDLLTLRHSDFREPVYDYRFHSKSLTARDKELGITTSRERLMVFEDFRRDFCLNPLVWVMDVNASDARARRFASRLRRHALNAGHVVYEHGQLNLADLPRLWVPAIYIQLASAASRINAPPVELPASMLKALIVIGDELPTEIGGDWDMCLTTLVVATPVRLAKEYQGWFVVSDSDLNTLFAAIDIRARSHHLELIEEEIVRPQLSECKVSVIICAYKRQDRLAQAVASAARQTFSADDFEVLVVNNDAENASFQSDMERLRTEYFRDRPHRLRTVTCPIPGLSHARNAAVGEAKGEVLCFLDDDAEVAPTWVEHIWTAFASHSKAGIIGGHIKLKVPEPRPRILYPGLEKYWSQFVTNLRGYSEVTSWWEFPWGANWSARKTVLFEIGGFRTSYGRRRHNFGGGEEVVAAALAQRLGHSVAVLPEAEALHDVEPHRYTWEHIKRTQIAGALANYQMQKALYVPMEASIPHTLATILHTPADPSIDGPRGIQRRDRRYRRSAYMHLLRQQIRDRRGRRSKPIATR
jgi:glycosyltransferase involved in cell wall biosynthesis